MKIYKCVIVSLLYMCPGHVPGHVTWSCDLTADEVMKASPTSHSGSVTPTNEDGSLTPQMVSPVVHEVGVAVCVCVCVYR